MRQIPLPIGPVPAPSFQNFVPGANAAALDHLCALAETAAPGAARVPVYLWGPSGSGKSHLLHALVRRHRQRGGVALTVDAATPLPWTLPPAASLVVIDDCDALDAARQHAAFTLFVEATGAAVQLAAAGRLPPVDLPVREDLRTRLGWGHVFALQPPTEAEVGAVLRQQAAARGITLGDEVVSYLLTRFERDLKHLMPLFERLDAYALAEQRPQLTVPLLKRMLAEGAPAR